MHKQTKKYLRAIKCYKHENVTIVLFCYQNDLNIKNK